MSQGRAQALRLHWLGVLLLGWLVLMLLTLSPVLGQEPPKPETQKPWTGKFAGKEITQADLDRILQAHASWVKSEGKEGKQADLYGANLSEANFYKANLSDAWLSYANLSGAWLRDANLSGATLIKANLSGAKLFDANLSGARLSYANLSGAGLIRANLRGTELDHADLRGAKLEATDLGGATLIKANLSGADLWKANLNGAKLTMAILNGADLYEAFLGGAVFEPKPGTVSDVTLLLNVQGLSSLKYINSSHGLVELREAYKKAGMREPERELTHALNHNRRVKLWEKSGLLNKVESLFNLVCFNGPASTA